jgi:hypothetical protein
MKAGYQHESDLQGHGEACSGRLTRTADNARSEALHLVERFRRRDFGHMDVEVTVDDPKMYTQTFTVKFPARLLPDTDILESVCAENEKDRVHLDR